MIVWCLKVARHRVVAGDRLTLLFLSFLEFFFQSQLLQHPVKELRPYILCGMSANRDREVVVRVNVPVVVGSFPDIEHPPVGLDELVKLRKLHKEKIVCLFKTMQR